MDARTDIKNFLEREGWTQDRLAEESGVHKVTINRILNGKRGAGGKTLKKLWPYLYAIPSQPQAGA